MPITDAQIREAVAGLVAIVEEERQVLVDSHGVAGEDIYTDPDVGDTVAHWDAQLAAGRAAIDEMDRRNAVRSRMRSPGVAGQ